LKEILKGRELPNSRFTRFLLRALEEDYYNAGSRETRIDLDQVDLEHIAPLSSLSSERYSTWAAVFNHNEERFDHYKSRLGNLTLLADRQNSRVRNGSYAEKCAEYEQSDITMTQRIPDNYPSWGFETIEDRTRTIAQDIVNLWGV
ncbi:HNH endonuclease family protein, partial [Halorubrum sp. Atlit-26R]